jgi:predicted cupin superfamily sugar epimerase
VSGLVAAQVVELLGLEPLPGEGGMWGQSWRDEHSSAIYYLLQPRDFSAFHRLSGVEIYHFYAGAPAELTLLHPDRRSETIVLGADLVTGQRPTHPVPAGTWQASRTIGPWTLLGTTMAPAYRPGGFELGRREELLAAHPDRAGEIEALTR